MPMMNIRVMCVTMLQPNMRMNMAVWFTRIPSLSMVMLMMCIMAMTVSMGQSLMYVRVFVPFAYVKPNPDGHQCRCQPEQYARHFRPKHE